MSKALFPAQFPAQPAGSSNFHPSTPTTVLTRPQVHQGLRGTAASRQHMVQRLQHIHGIDAQPVLAAMASVERHGFVDSALAGQAYEDTSLPIGFGQTISKPQVVARMLQLLLQVPMPTAAKILEIVTGCGYQAAVLAQLFGKVYSIERISGLHNKAQQHLLALHANGAKVGGIHLILGDGILGYKPAAPYHAIIAAAGGEELPPAWLEQLAPGGRLVAPIVQHPDGQQALVIVDKAADGSLRRQVLDAVHFVPLKSGLV